MTAVDGAINFLARDGRYEDEKPYYLKFPPPAGFARDNLVYDLQVKQVEDVRGREDGFSVAANGFAVMQLDEELAYDEYDDRSKVESVYCRQVAQGVRKLLGASRVQVFEHVVRKRHASFPVATGKSYQYNQPTNAAHIDITPTWAAGMAEHMNEMNGTQLPSKDYQFLNVWKPLRGPIQDWPLALCDPSTLGAADVRKSDSVFSTIEVEYYLVHPSADQKWYYLSNQTSSEAWVFLQADSQPRDVCGVPHSSFMHPDIELSAVPRESIEIRLIAFYDDGRPIQDQ